jgi:hypothetical protein
MSKAKRLEFHEILCSLLGSRNVYFQPPSTVRMQYPCIVYSRRFAETRYADNRPYAVRLCYSVMAIDADPDSGIPEKLGGLPLSQFDRHYTADNLNHDVYVIYY